MSVSVDKETQMTPQKANTPLKEIVSKETDGTVVLSVKTGTKRKRRKDCLSMIKQDYIHQYGE